NIGPILAHTSCKFIQPLIYPDTINVGVRIMNLGHTSFTMQHIIISDKLGLVATGEAVVVIYDYMLKEKVQLTPSFIDALETFEGRLLR
ncbi:MAG TPA: acyl-CoA thioesterase, partial [Chitinophagales bacterium]|nr:acyl-CoA thioesterase [Chitinophagales bacterium]